MNKIKQFFAPCMELLTLVEIKGLVLDAWQRMLQVFRILFNFLGWLASCLLVLSPLFLAIGCAWHYLASQCARAALRVFVAEVLIVVPPFFLALLALLAGLSPFFLWKFTMLSLLRDPAESQDWSYMKSVFKKYLPLCMGIFFGRIFFDLLPALLVLLVVLVWPMLAAHIHACAPFCAPFVEPLWYTVWLFIWLSILFLLETEPSVTELCKALSRGFYLLVRFFPLIIIMLTIPKCLFVNADIFLVIRRLSGASGISQRLVSMVFAFMSCLPELALIAALYKRVTSRFPELFFDKA